MTGKTHAAFAVSLMPVAAAVSPQLQHQIAQENFFFFVGMFIGSLFPDFDTDKSAIARKFHFYIAGLERRGVSHTIYLDIILSVVFYVVIRIFTRNWDPIFANLFIWTDYGFFFGYLSHLFLDMLTPMGVPILYPFKGTKHKYHIAEIEIGSMLEVLIFILLLTFVIVAEGPYFHCLLFTPSNHLNMCKNFFTW